MTVREAAEYLGLSPTTVRNQINNGALAATKVGRDWLIERHEADRYRRDRMRDSGGGTQSV
jgi:excisionase family DNA binding protein